MNGDGKIGLDRTGMRSSSGSEKMKRTRSVEPSGSGMKVISRSKGFRSAYERRSNSKKISALFVCAAAIIIVSGMALASIGNGNVAKGRGHIEAPLPPPPFLLYGYCTDSLGAPVPFCNINVTDLSSGNYSTTVADVDGLYSFQVDSFYVPYADGDTLQVVANTTTLIGTSQWVLVSSPPYHELDVVLSSGAIPEFTDIAIPIAGMISIFVVARVASSRNKEE